MTAYLLDANVLIALTVAEHEHHGRARSWLAAVDRFAVCPIGEGALARFLLRVGESSATASAVLTAVRSARRCDFWADTLSYAEVDLTTVVGHRQLTDTYLAALATHHGGRLATFDAALAQRLPNSCLLVP